MNDAFSDPFTLFVYGTLMRGGVRSRLLAGQRFRGEGRTLPCYGLFDLGDYPGMVRLGAGGAAVSGELYEVASELVPALDREEGAPTLFRLEPVEIEGGGTAFAYLYQGPVAGRPPCPGPRRTRRGGR